MIHQDVPTNARIAVIWRWSLRPVGRTYPQASRIPARHCVREGRHARREGADRSQSWRKHRTRRGVRARDYEVTLQLAKEVGGPTIGREVDSRILDEDGTLVPMPQFALRKYGAAQFQSALGRCKALSDKYRLWERRGFAGLPLNCTCLSPNTPSSTRLCPLPISSSARLWLGAIHITRTCLPCTA